MPNYIKDLAESFTEKSDDRAVAEARALWFKIMVIITLFGGALEVLRAV